MSRGGKTTKIHAVVDGLGNPVRFMLKGCQIHDSKAAVELFSELDISGSNILADKACKTLEIHNYIIKHHANYTIPPKSKVIEPWVYDFSL